MLLDSSDLLTVLGVGLAVCLELAEQVTLLVTPRCVQHELRVIELLWLFLL